MHQPRPLIPLFLALLAGCNRPAPTPPPAASQPTTAPTTQKTPTTRYVQVIHALYPKLPTTEPLGTPVDLTDAGHFIIHRPVYLDGRGDLWVSDRDGPSIADVMKTAADAESHVVREIVRYVLWGVDDFGKTVPRVVIARPDGSEQWIDGDQKHPLPAGRKYRWADAELWNDSVVVPTDRGISIFTFAPDYAENYHEIISSADANPPQIVFDATGILAFSPWDGKKPGSRGASRFINNHWINLTDQSHWPEKILHLVPLLDGSALQLLHDDDGKLGINMLPLDSQSDNQSGANQSRIDEAAIGKLVEQLSDDDPDKRASAFAELTRYGPPSWPVLEKLLPDQPPGAQMQIKQLLRSRIKPTLGGRTVIDNIAHLVDRLDDGGIVLFAPAGVSIPREDQKPLIIKPGWLSIRPGRAIELMPPVLVKDANPDTQRIFAFGDEWLIDDPALGPMRLLGNHLEPMLHKAEAAWSEVIGIDRRGRWLFRKPADDSATLIIDPTLPDPTPRLPVWLMFVEKGQTGWTQSNWPAVKRGGAWQLNNASWQPVNDAHDKLITELPPQAASVQRASTTRIAATSLATKPTSSPATISTTSPTTSLMSTSAPAHELPDQPPLLIDAQGNRYYDGRRTLRIINSAGRDLTWPLPVGAMGDATFKPILLHPIAGAFFLFNRPGVVLRLKPTPNASEPFVLEATFTHRIPSSDDIRRIWLDPAGRIDIAYEGNRLAILFPQGRIPRNIELLIPASEADEQP